METSRIVKSEIDYYNALPCVFKGFMDMPPLSDGIISLVLARTAPAIPERKRVPVYFFDVCAGEERVGEASLRIGYVDSLYYGGQIAYEIDEAHRGKGYAVRACRLLAPVARHHGMGKLLITNDENNTASFRVCEKLGARFVRKAELPDWHDLYERGQRFVNIFEWNVPQDSENAGQIAYYNALPCVFDNFMDVPALCDDTIQLICVNKYLVDFYGNQIPTYVFDICAGDVKVGGIKLRIGYTEAIYYSGHIGYNIDEAHRGNGYAARACRLLVSVAKFHAMPKLLITNNDDNIASFRVCEKLGARLVRKAELPNWHDSYKEGHRYKNIFEMDIFVFNGFMDVPPLSDGVISLECTEKIAAIPEEGKVPLYFFDIYKDGAKVGGILLRIGYSEEIYYSGHIGYGIDEAHRGKGYAVRACRLLAPVARHHGMAKLIITNDIANAASQRVCEKLGAKFARTADIPQWHHEYEEGFRYMNIFEWDLYCALESERLL